MAEKLTNSSEGKATPSDEVSIWLAVYEARRGDARQRVANQFVILAGAVALAGALIPIVQHSSPELRWQILLFASVIFGLLGGLYLDQHQSVNQTGRYLRDVLWPRLNDLVGQDRNLPPFGWEKWLVDVDRKGWHKAAFGMSLLLRLLTTGGVGLSCLVVSLILCHSRQDHLNWYDWIAVGFDAILYGGVGIIIASLIGKNILDSRSG